MQAISYSRHRFPPELIRHAVWLYLSFTLSYRDVEQLLAARGRAEGLSSKPATSIASPTA
jgi:transposase-like protein